MLLGSPNKIEAIGISVYIWLYGLTLIFNSNSNRSTIIKAGEKSHLFTNKKQIWITFIDFY